MLEKVNKLVEKVNGFTPNSEEEVNNFRIEYLGKKGLLNDLFSAFKEVSSDQKKDFGAAINNLKVLVQNKIEDYKDSFETEETERLTVHETLPEPYSTILNYKGGPEALELYIALHPKALFRD